MGPCPCAALRPCPGPAPTLPPPCPCPGPAPTLRAPRPSPLVVCRYVDVEDVAVLQLARVGYPVADDLGGGSEGREAAGTR